MDQIQLLPDFSMAGSAAMYFAAVGLQAAIFLSALAILSHLIFRPLIKILSLRRKSIDEVEKKTQDFQENGIVLAEEYKWRMEGAMQLADEKREIARMMGRRRAEMILSDVKRETNRDIESVIKSAEDAYHAVVPAIEGDINKFGMQISENILRV